MSTTMIMKTIGIVWLAGAVLFVTDNVALAQEDEDLAAAARAAEARLQAEQENSEQAVRDAETRAGDVRRRAEQRARDAEARQADREREMAARMTEREESAEARMRLAEERLAEAARQVAELSMQQLPRVERIERVIRQGRRPVLGITIGDETVPYSEDPVEGVRVLGVSPGGAAAEAGLRADDIITAINGESMAAESGAAASSKLFEFMNGVEDGDALDIAFLRNGKAMSAEVKPQVMRHAFAFRFGDDEMVVPDAPLAPGAPRANVFRDFNFFLSDGAGGFGDMELVKLTDRLGSYFGTSEGLLIVRAPVNEDYELQDGDVILNIDGRVPASVSHAMRILGSYEPGETVILEIMRDRRKRKIEIEMPDRRKGWVDPAFAPAIAPGAPSPVEERVVIIETQ